MPQLTWLVTGTASGFGEQLVYSILARGDRVIATARQAHGRLQPLKEAGAAILDLDVRASQSELDVKAKEALAIYGGIDVLVNNAAQIVGGILEETSTETFLESFNTILFGPMNLTRSFLPYFRENRKGVLLYMSSVGAYYGAVGAGAYCASKSALESAVECLKEETSPYGLQFCLLTPGYYRTDIFAPHHIKFGPSTIPDYEASNKKYQEEVKAAHGHQPGDPRKATDLIVDVVRSEGKATGKQIPFRLPIGPDGLATIRAKYTKLTQICDEWSYAVVDTNYGVKMPFAA